jgi:hypothetical protein
MSPVSTVRLVEGAVDLSTGAAIRNTAAGDFAVLLAWDLVRLL